MRTATAAWIWARSAIALAAMAVPAAGQYTGAEACARCHPGHGKRQAATGHARSLARASATVPVGKQYRRGPATLEYFTRGGGLRLKAWDTRDEFDIPVEWAFGAGAQATTFVSRIDRDWYVELSLTYYARLGGFAPSPGHEELRPATAKDALGIVYPALDPKAGMVGCFECHSTGTAAVGGEIRVGELGVRCESCHGAGSDHGRLLNPGKLSPVGLNQMCGRCHRPPAAKGETIDWNYPWNLRHQPVYLAESRCFNSGKSGLSCLSCHAPHDGLRANDAAHYRSRCTGCHAPAAACGDAQKADCVACHMPRVSPQSGLVFHNHWIGVYESGRFLKPRR